MVNPEFKPGDICQVKANRPPFNLFRTKCMLAPDFPPYAPKERINEYRAVYSGQVFMIIKIEPLHLDDGIKKTMELWTVLISEGVWQTYGLHTKSSWTQIDRLTPCPQ